MLVKKLNDTILTMSTEASNLFQPDDEGRLSADQATRLVNLFYQRLVHLADLPTDPLSPTDIATSQIQSKASIVLDAVRAGKISFEIYDDEENFPSSRLSTTSVACAAQGLSLDKGEEKEVDDVLKTPSISILINLAEINNSSYIPVEELTQLVEEELVFDISVAADFLGGAFIDNGFVATMREAARLSYHYNHRNPVNGQAVVRRVPEAELEGATIELSDEMQLADTTFAEFQQAIQKKYDKGVRRKRTDEDLPILQHLEELLNEHGDVGLRLVFLQLLTNANVLATVYHLIIEQEKTRIILEEPSLNKTYSGHKEAGSSAYEYIHTLPTDQRQKLVAKAFVQVWIQDYLEAEKSNITNDQLGLTEKDFETGDEE